MSSLLLELAHLANLPTITKFSLAGKPAIGRSIKNGGWQPRSKEKIELATFFKQKIKFSKITIIKYKNLKIHL